MVRGGPRGSSEADIVAVAEAWAFTLTKIFAVGTAFVTMVWDIARIIGSNGLAAFPAGDSFGGRPLMDDVERDGSITINIGYGNITFSRDEGGAYASAIIDLCVDTPCGADRVELALKIQATPESETIAAVVERSRTRIVTLLRQAAAHFEAETAESLLYPSSGGREL